MMTERALDLRAYITDNKVRINGSVSELAEIAECYAEKIDKIGLDKFDVLVTKGIREMAMLYAIGITLVGFKNQNKLTTSIREEAKDHREKGIFMGANLADGVERNALMIMGEFDEPRRYSRILRLFPNETHLMGILVGIDTAKPGALERFVARYNIPIWPIIK